MQQTQVDLSDYITIKDFLFKAVFIRHLKDRSCSSVIEQQCDNPAAGKGQSATYAVSPFSNKSPKTPACKFKIPSEPFHLNPCYDTPSLPNVCGARTPVVHS